jgi:hypothetical protein
VEDPTYLEHKLFKIDAVSLKDVLGVSFERYTVEVWWMVALDFFTKLWVGVGVGTGLEARVQSCWLITGAAINCVLFLRYR